MYQMNIMLHDGTHLIFTEYDLYNEIDFYISRFEDDDDYLVIEKENGKELVINKEYIVAINVEEADEWLNAY